MRTFFLQRHIWAAGAWIFVVSFSGGMLTEIGPWYLNLKHPDWKPPDWAFGIIWTTIFILAAFAWSIAWQRTQTVKQRLTLSTLFIANALCNMLWSVLYFKLHRPDWSLIEAFFLWGSVLAIILVTRSYSTLSGWFMMPYLIWVSCAIALNYETIRLNGPFN